MDEKTIARFWSKVDRNGPAHPYNIDKGPCWLWMAYRRQSGYGQIGIGNKLYVTSRVAWEIANGPIPAGRIFVCHTCDNPPCVNPGHLWLGSDLDNVRDCWTKGRGVVGPRAKREKHYGWTITDDERAECVRLTNLGYTSREVGTRYGVSERLVDKIRRLHGCAPLPSRRKKHRLPPLGAPLYEVKNRRADSRVII